MKTFLVVTADPFDRIVTTRLLSEESIDQALESLAGEGDIWVVKELPIDFKKYEANADDLGILLAKQSFSEFSEVNA